jgi:hypothetical protein
MFNLDRVEDMCGREHDIVGFLFQLEEGARKLRKRYKIIFTDLSRVFSIEE